MKERLDLHQLECAARRGTDRVPECVAGYLDNELGPDAVYGPFPYPRYWLWLELWCPKLAGQADYYDRYETTELQVQAFYRGVVPWLAWDLAPEEPARRAADLLDVIDELVGRQSELFRSAVGWPLAELVGVFEDVLDTLVTAWSQDLAVVWSRDEQLNVGAWYTEALDVLLPHRDCCAEVMVNVHWW